MLFLPTLLIAADEPTNENAAAVPAAGENVAGATPEPPKDVMTEFWEFITNNGMEFLLNLAIAIAIFIVGRWVAKAIVAFVRRMVTRANLDAMLTAFLCNILYALLLVFVILAALDRLGVDTTSFAAVMAAAGLAIGLALQGSLSNFASGAMIIIFKPFQIGNFIEAGGTAGVVKEIQIFNTVLDTFDNIRIIVPNAQITGGTITNYSANDTRRIDLVIGCGYDDDLKAVKEFLLDTVTSDERVLKDPEPTVAVNELGDNSVNFVVRPWVNSSDFGATRFDLIERIKLGFDERGFNFPYPQTDVHLHQESA